MANVEITNLRVTNWGEKRRHWDIIRDGKHIANLGASCRGWTRFSVLPVSEAGSSSDGYMTFSSKAAALAYAATL